jgi:hypothetical protein
MVTTEVGKPLASSRTTQILCSSSLVILTAASRCTCVDPESFDAILGCSWVLLQGEAHNKKGLVSASTGIVYYRA